MDKEKTVSIGIDVLETLMYNYIKNNLKMSFDVSGYNLSDNEKLLSISVSLSLEGKPISEHEIEVRV